MKSGSYLNSRYKARLRIRLDELEGATRPAITVYQIIRRGAFRMVTVAWGQLGQQDGGLIPTHPGDLEYW